MNQNSFFFIYFSIILISIMGFGSYFIYQKMKNKKLPKEEYINIFDFLVKYDLIKKIDEDGKLNSIPIEDNCFSPARECISYTYHYGDIKGVGKIIHIISAVQYGTIVPRKNFYMNWGYGSINDYKITLIKESLEKHRLFVNEALIKHYGLEKMINVI